MSWRIEKGAWGRQSRVKRRHVAVSSVCMMMMITRLNSATDSDPAYEYSILDQLLTSKADCIEYLLR